MSGTANPGHVIDVHLSGVVGQAGEPDDGAALFGRTEVWLLSFPSALLAAAIMLLFKGKKANRKEKNCH